MISWEFFETKEASGSGSDSWSSEDGINRIGTPGVGGDMSVIRGVEGFMKIMEMMLTEELRNLW